MSPGTACRCIHGRPFSPGVAQKGAKGAWPGKHSQVQKENRLFPVRTFLILQVKPQGTEGLGGKVEAGDRPAGPSGQNIGGAPPGGEMVTETAEKRGGLLPPALARLWVGGDGREFLEPSCLSGAMGRAGGAAFCTGELARLWALLGAPCTLPR